MASEIITRKEARARGLKRYFTGQRCCRGHLDERLVSNKTCYGCFSEDQRERQSTESGREKRREYDRLWTANNKQRRADRRKALRGKALEGERRWIAANRQRYLKRKLKWRTENPEKNRYYAGVRRARERAAEGCFTPTDVLELLSTQKHRCAYCRQNIRRGYHVDHIVPLSKGGSNKRNNIQLTCKRCNQTKHAKDPLVFARERGRLL